MKAQCEKCKEIADLELRAETSGVWVRCPACGADYAEGKREEAPRAPAAEMTCPKCGAGQPRGDACRRCGLVFAKWGPGQKLPEPDDAVAATLWDACERSWDDDAGHLAFIEHCRRAGALAYAAARYRKRGAADRLAQIRTLAESTLAVSPRREQRPRSSRMMIGLLVLVIVLAAFMLAMRWS